MRLTITVERTAQAKGRKPMHPQVICDLSEKAIDMYQSFVDGGMPERDAKVNACNRMMAKDINDYLAQRAEIHEERWTVTEQFPADDAIVVDAMERR